MIRTSMSILFKFILALAIGLPIGLVFHKLVLAPKESRWSLPTSTWPTWPWASVPAASAPNEPVASTVELPTQANLKVPTVTSPPPRPQNAPPSAGTNRVANHGSPTSTVPEIRIKPLPPANSAMPAPTVSASTSAPGLPAARPARILAETALSPAPDSAATHDTNLPRLRTSVLVAGARHNSADGQIALPHDTRFQLEIASDHAGTLQIRSKEQGDAILWSGEISAGIALETPFLHLTGSRGLEVLYVALHIPGQGVTARQQVTILHQ